MYLHITSCIGYIIFPYKDGAWLTLHSASHTIVRATPSFSWTGPGDSVSNWRSGPLTVRYALPSVAMSPDGCTVSENRANVWSLDVRRPSGGLTGAEIHRLHIASTVVASNDGHRIRTRSSRFAKLTGC